ncbi:MAG: hydrogenase nickel incorporation protein HypB [Bacillota bacterium]
MSVLTIERKVLEKNDMIASELRSEFKEREIFAINILSSPGSGKTSIIEQIARCSNGELKAAVIAGDVQTDNDARRIDKLGIPVVQIVTNGGCHLEADLVRDAYRKLSAEKFNFLIIENVGNLVCPAGFDLGESIKAVILSTTEGEDKPLKYPAAFRKASILVINKTDLLPYVSAPIWEIKRNALSVNPALSIFETSCKTGKGIKELCSWIKLQCK